MRLPNQLFTSIAGDLTKFVIHIKNATHGIGGADDHVLIHREALVEQLDTPCFLLCDQAGQ